MKDKEINSKNHHDPFKEFKEEEKEVKDNGKMKDKACRECYQPGGAREYSTFSSLFCNDCSLSLISDKLLRDSLLRLNKKGIL